MGLPTFPVCASSSLSLSASASWNTKIDKLPTENWNMKLVIPSLMLSQVFEISITIIYHFLEVKYH